MKPISLKHKIIILITITVLLLAAISVFIIYPSFKQILELKEQISITQSFLEDRRIKTKLIQRSTRELPRISEEVDALSSIFWKEGEELKFIKELETIAETHQLKQTISVKNKERKTNFLIYNLSFLNYGLFQNQMDYISSLENLPYYFHINELKWERRGEATTSTPISLYFEAQVYALPSEI